jgi:glycosyltransferase involved in cell wall biosynthesis
MRVLVVVQGGVGTRVAGPAIRGWAMARALAEHHDVTVAVDEPSETSRDGLRLISNRRRELVREAPRHDAVVAPSLPPYLLAVLRRARTVTVSDQYDPVWLETAVLTEDPGAARRLRAQRMTRDAQVRFADVIAVAGSAQLSLLQDELERLAHPRSSPPRIVTVPFGVPEPPARAARHPLRAAFPQIGRNDPIVLWWGKVWKWFDHGTAIRAFGRVVKDHPDARLVITAGKAPAVGLDAYDRTEDARELSRALGLLNRSVFFLDEWTPYDRRHEYLLDADVGLTLHGNTAEAPFAARARYMDYLWAGLPCVLGSGDETASAFADAGFASLVPPGDVDAAACAMLHLLEDRSARESARAAGLRLADRYRWPAVIEPLALAIADCHAHPRRDSQEHLGNTIARYYLQRTVDHVAAFVR